MLINNIIISMTENLLDALNENQREAVAYSDGPSLVIAGAGSGKTRVLTYKIAYLIQQGMKPWNILALTFTNKAAREMKERIGALVGARTAQYIYMGTFHSIFARILRKEAEVMGYTSNFTIYDETDSRTLLKSIIRDMQLDDKQYKPATVHARISMAKNRLVLPSLYANDADQRERDRQARLDETYKIYHAYQDRLRQANAMDFDDLLVITYQLFSGHPDICQRYADYFRYVLVDEYQDTNSVQQQIVLLLTRGHQHVCVVGDDYQSIYAFRGAQIDNILNFQQFFGGVRIFKLERNYRSTPEIVQAANSLMKHNQHQIDKDVYSKNAKGDKVVYRPVYSDREEAAVVCKMIRSIKRSDGCAYSDFAILYRTNAQSRTFEDELRAHAMPYRIFGGLSFYQRKEIKDVIAYYRVIVNPDDEEALKRIINYPARGIGSTTVDKIQACATEHHVSLWQVVTHPTEHGLAVNRGTLGKLGLFAQLIDTFRSGLDEQDAEQLGQRVIKESGIYADLCQGTDVEALTRRENVEELLNSLSEFVDGHREEGRGERVGLADFLQEVSLLSDLDSDDGGDDKVNLMTVHAAKGLEFSTVFVVGLEEKIFPSQMASGSPREIEEERRLLYVAITRAEHHCILTSAKNRWRYGKLEFGTPSRFISDISPKYLNVIGEGSDEAEAGSRRKHSLRGGDYESDRPYQGARVGQDEFRQLNGRWQNSRPVAGQFMADLKPKVTSPRKTETAVDPFGSGFKRQYVANGGKLTRLKDAIANSGRSLAVSTAGASSATALQVGTVIEHQRFGIGTVIRIEGTGENTKATVEFKNTGTKQLLLKFARFTIKSLFQ